jgi:hypothetical protein
MSTMTGVATIRDRVDPHEFGAAWRVEKAQSRHSGPNHRCRTTTYGRAGHMECHASDARRLL